MTAELEGSLPSQSNILSKFVGTILVLMNSLSALVLIYENVGLWHKVKLDPVDPQMRPCEIVDAGQSHMIMHISNIEIGDKEVVFKTKP
jgi:hypothetical protein